MVLLYLFARTINQSKGKAQLQVPKSKPVFDYAALGSYLSPKRRQVPGLPDK